MQQKPDTRPGHYYVSVIDGDRRSLLAGPWPTHKAALDRVDSVRSLALEVDTKSAFYAFGTARIDLTVADFPQGKLNGLLKPRSEYPDNND